MVPLHSDPPDVDYPRSGHTRVSCDEPCELLSLDGYRRQGKIWNLSSKGVYAVVPEPFPPVGRTLLLSFVLAADPMPITCEARVEWHNAPSLVRGCGAVKPGLPPGCGLSFRVLDSQDARRVLARIVALHRKSLRS
jgi:hypothetical protein